MPIDTSFIFTKERRNRRYLRLQHQSQCKICHGTDLRGQAISIAIGVGTHAYQRQTSLSQRNAEQNFSFFLWRRKRVLLIKYGHRSGYMNICVTSYDGVTSTILYFWCK